jgi:hypothetical protein
MLLCELIFKPHTHSLAHWQEELGGFFKIAAQRVLRVCVLLSLRWLEINFYLARISKVPARRQKGLVLKIAPVKGFALFFPLSRERATAAD